MSLLRTYGLFSLLSLLKGLLLRILIVVDLLDPIMHFFDFEDSARLPAKGDSLQYWLSALNLAVNRHFDFSCVESSEETLDLGCRVEDVLLQVSLLRVPHIDEGILHAEDQ